MWEQHILQQTKKPLKSPNSIFLFSILAGLNGSVRYF